MKKFTYVLIAVIAVGFLACLPDVYDNNYDETEYDNVSYVFEAAPYTDVRIETENGEITSSVKEADSIEVTLRLWATGDDDEEAREHISDIDVRITEDTVLGKLSIRVDIPDNANRGYGGDVTIYLPDSVYIDLETANGKVEADGHRNGIDIHTSNGAIEVSNTAGEADLETSNGEIDVDLHEGEITGETSNGAVDAKIIMPVNDGLCRFESSNGDIRVAVPDSVGASVTLKTSYGDIEVLSLNVTPPVGDEDSYEGEIGSGTGTIYLSTSNGNVILEKLQ